MRTFTTTEELAGAIGQELGTSGWLEIDQDRIDAFADATLDHQWIHVDQERAKAGPFGGTIAHGYFTLALIPWIANQVFRLETPGAKLNYGVNKVRFPHPVKVGSRVRGHVSLTGVEELPTGTQLTLKYVVEIEGETRPACVAETVVLLIP